MADNPVRAYGPAQPGTTNATLYTVPGATEFIMRHIRIVNTTGSAATITLAVAGSSDTAANHILSALSIPKNAAYDWTGFLVLEASETIQGKQGTSSALTVTISGVQVTP